MGSGHSQAEKWKEMEEGGDLAEKFGFTEAQVKDLIEAFKTESGKHFDVTPKQFTATLNQIRSKHPDLVLIDEDVSELLFSFVDCDHDGKGNPLELIAALSAFSVGNSDDKARLVFRTLDRNNDGFLSKAELRKHSKKILVFSARLVRTTYKKHMKEANLGALGKMAGWAIEKGIKAAEDPMSEDIEKEIFRFNKSGDGKLTMEEWLEATRECNTGKALIHPNHAGKVWMFLYSPEECEGGEEKIAEIQNHPKRWAHLFDMMELEEPVYVPPPPFLVTFQWRKVGEEGKEEKTVDLSLKERTFGEMKKIGFELSGILLGRVLLRHGDGREECVIHCREASDYVDVVSGGCVEVVDKKLLKGTLIVSTRTTRSPGKKIEVEGVEYEKTVGWCKQKIQESEGIPPKQQRLTSNGKILSDDKQQLGDAGVFPGCIIYLAS